MTGYLWSVVFRVNYTTGSPCCLPGNFLGLRENNRRDVSRHLCAWQASHLHISCSKRQLTSVTAVLRHRCLQAAVIYMCSIGQLSPGAYFLRQDLFGPIATVGSQDITRNINSNGVLQFIKSPKTERFTFEAIILLGVLANYHKSEAAKLNPYLLHMKGTDDEELMRKVCWASNFAAETVIKSVFISD